MRAPAGQTSLSMVAKTDPAVYVQEACWWVRRNPEGFRRLMALLHRQVDRGNPRSQRSMVYLYDEREGIAIESGELDGIVRDHNLWAVLARYMVMLRPRLARTLHFKRAGADDVDLVGEWHSIVDSRTEFYAKDWKEAERLVEIGDASAM